MKNYVLLITLLTGLFITPSLSYAQEDDHQATPCEVEDLFYTVQLGVYTQQIPAEAFPKVAAPIYYIKIADDLYLYFSGIFDCRFAAMRKRYYLVKACSYDVYVACYYKKEQISIGRADELLEENGKDILYKPEPVDSTKI